MKRTLLAVAALALALPGCGARYYRIAFDEEAAQRGEVFLQTVAGPDGGFKTQLVALVNAPPWRVWNVLLDVDSYPQWQPALEQSRVVRRDGDRVEYRYRTPGDSEEAAGVVRFDRERWELTLLALENDALREAQWIYKLEPRDNGVRTLLTLYALSDRKGARPPAKFEKELLADLTGLRRVVMEPRYAQSPFAETGSSLGKVVVPAFRAEGAPPALARTVTRVFAQQLVRTARWSVLPPDEAAFRLDATRQRGLLGCGERGSCAVELGRALDAERVVQGTVAFAGEAYVVTAALLRLPEGRVERKVTARAKSPEELLDPVRAAATELAAP